MLLGCCCCCCCCICCCCCCCCCCCWLCRGCRGRGVSSRGQATASAPPAADGIQAVGPAGARSCSAGSGCHRRQGREAPPGRGWQASHGLAAPLKVHSSATGSALLLLLLLWLVLPGGARQVPPQRDAPPPTAASLPSCSVQKVRLPLPQVLCLSGREDQGVVSAGHSRGQQASAFREGGSGSSQARGVL